MTSGTDKLFTQRMNNVLPIPIGITGVGEEKHPTIEVPIIEKDLMKERILNIIIEKEEMPEGKSKLYLKPIRVLINKLLNNKVTKNKITQPSILTKLKIKFLNWWRKDITNDSKDLIKFVFIHGFLGAFTLLTLLTIFNIDILLIQLIRQSIWITCIIYILGAGSFYYLFLDVNVALEETWRKKKK